MDGFFSELKRRNVLRVGIAYLTIAWLVIEVANTILPLFDVGPGASRLIVILFAIGFLPVLLFTWIFEFTPGGIRLDKDVDRSASEAIAGTKRFDRLIIILLGIALAYFAVDKFILLPQRESALVDAAREDAASQALDKARAADVSRSVAVLPFENTSGDPSNDYRSEGLSDDLRDSLGEVPGMLVVARRSSILTASMGLDAKAIAEQLGVGRVIEGQFKQQGEKVIVSIELIDASTGFQLWTQRYERASSELLLLQQEIARAVSSELMPAGQSQVAATQPTAQQVSAYDLLMLGRQYEQQVTDQQVVDETRLNKAIELYRQAIAADPRSAEAHARLGKMLLYVGDADAAAEPIFTALKLDPKQSDANATVGLYYWATRQPGIGAAYARAIELNPNNAEAMSYYADWLWLQGSPDAAEVYFRRARDLDPLSLERQSKLGYKLAFSGKREEAEAIASRIFESFPNVPGYLAAARIHETAGSPAEAIALELKALSLEPDNADISGQLAESLARIGDFESAAIFEPEPGIGLLFWSRRYDELIDLGQELMIEFPDDEDMLLLQAFALNTKGRYAESMRIYESLDMPRAVLSESRRSIELHQTKSVVEALEALGRVDEAADLARWYRKINDGMMKGDEAGWGPQLARACLDADDGDIAGALTSLERLPESPTIVWMPYLRDTKCMQRLASEPRYQAVLAALEKRLAAIRAELPKVLRQQGLMPVSAAQK